MNDDDGMMRDEPNYADDNDDEQEQMIYNLTKDMPPLLQLQVEELRDLFAINGDAREVANRRIVELFSPPRVTKELKHMKKLIPGLAMMPGSTFDLSVDENGNRYNFLLAADRRRARARLRRERPWLIVGSLSCM